MRRKMITRMPYWPFLFIFVVAWFFTSIKDKTRQGFGRLIEWFGVFTTSIFVVYSFATGWIPTFMFYVGPFIFGLKLAKSENKRDRQMSSVIVGVCFFAAMAWGTFKP
jgi:hypothetical protein